MHVMGTAYNSLPMITGKIFFRFMRCGLLSSEAFVHLVELQGEIHAVHLSPDLGYLPRLLVYLLYVGGQLVGGAVAVVEPLVEGL